MVVLIIQFHIVCEANAMPAGQLQRSKDMLQIQEDFLIDTTGIS